MIGAGCEPWVKGKRTQKSGVNSLPTAEDLGLKLEDLLQIVGGGGTGPNGTVRPLKIENPEDDDFGILFILREQDIPEDLEF